MLSFCPLLRKNVSKAGRFEMPSAYALGIVRGKIIFYLGFRKVCGLFGIPFSRNGVVTGSGSFKVYFCISESL